MKFNIVDLFQEKARETPKKTALVYRNRHITFGEFEKSILETAQYFLQKGISKGDRVMVFLPMSDDLYRVVLALFKIGATAVFLDEWINIKRLNACCELANCKAFIGTFKGQILAWFVPGLRKIPLHLGLKYSTINETIAIPETTKDDIALITFTTGSTGIPKAAIRTHGLLLEQFKALTPLIDPQPNDVSMAVLPIVLLINLAAGVTSVIADYKASKPSSLKPQKIIDQIEENAVNSIIASPFFVKEISKYIAANSIHISEVEKIFTGGAPVFPQEAKIYEKAFPQTKIEIVYGSTEAEPISSVSANVLIKKEGNPGVGLFVGKPDSVSQVKIIRIKDENISVANEAELIGLEQLAGQIGEIIVSGPHVLTSYLNNEEALKRNKIFIGEICWHRTGDSGYLDQDGYLFLTGRCNNLIHSENKIISPFMYENLFQNINGIEIGTVMLLESKFTALIELETKSKREAVEKELSLLPEKLEQIISVKKIPRDPRHNSKIDYEKLKLMIMKSKS